MADFFGTSAGDTIDFFFLSAGVTTNPPGLTGTAGGFNNFVSAGGGNDFVWSGFGADVVFGGLGVDELRGWTGDDDLFGEGGDSLYGEDGDDELFGGAGNDNLYGGWHNDELSGEAGGDFLDGELGNDRLLGQEGDDKLVGDTGDDYLDAGAGTDLVRGGNGFDTIIGGFQGDILLGGQNADTFRYNNLQGSLPSARDQIRATGGIDSAAAFEGVSVFGGDVIDVAGIDANATAGGNQAFIFDGGTGKGHLWCTNSGNDTFVNGNVNNNPNVDFRIEIEDGQGIVAANYFFGDFIL